MRKLNLMVVVSFSSLFLTSCFPDYRLNFNKEKVALISCDERIKIKHINVSEVGSEDLGYQIRLNNSIGSDTVYLEKYNKGYSSNDTSFKLKPNKEYIIRSMFGDTGINMKIHTNSECKVDSVLN